MIYRKQTQHIRMYRSGRWTCVNRGIKYLKRKKTFGSAWFRDQIRNQFFGSGDRKQMLEYIQRSGDENLQYVITDPLFGSDKLVDFLEKNPDIYSTIKNSKIAFLSESSDLGKVYSFPKYGEIIAIRRDLLDQPSILKMDWLTGGYRDATLVKVMRHEAAHIKHKDEHPIHDRWDEVIARYAEEHDPKREKSKEAVEESFRKFIG